MANWRLILTGLISFISIIAPAQSVFTVTKTTDLSPFTYNNNDALCDPNMLGTFQWAIRKANDATGASKIVFNIPEFSSHIINLNYSLPLIQKQVDIDGTTQLGSKVTIQLPMNINQNYIFWFNGAAASNSIIQGMHLSGFGYDMVSWGTIGIMFNNMENGIIRNNVLTNLTDYMRCEYANNCEIYGNLVGVDENGIISSGNGTIGLQIFTGNNNIIGGSGDKANTFVHFQIGIGINSGNHNKITQNKMMNFSNRPIFLSTYNPYLPAPYANDLKAQPIINNISNLSNVTGTSAPGDVVELFGSAGNKNANEYLTSVTTDANGNWTADLTSTFRTYISATATDANNNTSELITSNQFVNTPCASCTKLKFCHPDIACSDKEVSFINQSINCISNPAFVWNYGDGSASSTSPVHTYSTAGTYTVTLSYPSSGYCQEKTLSSVIHIFDNCLNPCAVPPEISVVSSNGNATICPGTSSTLTSSGADTYTWSPATGLSATTGATVIADPISTTTYTVTGTKTVGGCTNTATLTVYIKPAPSIGISATNTAVCAGESTTITASNGVSYTWSPATGLSSTTGNSVTAIVSDETLYTVIGTDECGLTGTANITINVKGSSNSINLEAANLYICTGGTTNITANGANTYTWSPSSSLSSGTGNSVMATPVETTTYTIIGTSDCDVTATNEITIYVNEPQPIFVSAETYEICNGQSTTMYAEGVSTYSWSPNAGLTPGEFPTHGDPEDHGNYDLTAPRSAVIASPTETTTYTVTGTDACGLTNTQTITLFVNQKPTIALQSYDGFNVCSGGSTSIYAEGASTYSWSPATDLDPGDISEHNSNPLHSYSTNGSAVTVTLTETTTYTVTGTSSCGETDTQIVTIFVNHAPDIFLSAVADIICSGGTTTLNAGGASTYTWTPTTGLSAATGSSVTATLTETTTYTVTGTSECGITNTGTITINVEVPPTVLLTATSNSICSGNNTVISAQGASAYTWSPSAGLSSVTGNSVTANPTVTTTYTVNGTNTCVTTGEAIITINVTEIPNISLNTNAATICIGNNIQLAASGAANYVWTPSTGLSSTIGSDVIANPTQTTTYSVTGTMNGCSAIAFSTITANATVPEVGVAVTPSYEICAGTSVTLSGTGASSYSWTGGITNGVPFTPSTALSLSKVDFASGTQPWFIAIGDIDGDGKKDIAVTNYNNSTVSVFRNTSTTGIISNSSFASKVEFNVGITPRGVAIADIDGDGKNDIVVANHSGTPSSSISLLRNTSTVGSITTSSMAAKVDFTVGGNPDEVVVEDIDGDSKKDVVVATDLGKTISIFRNISTMGSITTGSLASKVDFPTVNQTQYLTIRDIDGDGKKDIVSNISGGAIGIFRNISTPGFITNASLEANVDFTTGSLPRKIEVEDIDGDGKGDILVATSGSLTVLKNISTSGSITTSSLAAKVDFTAGAQTTGVATGDIDGDGKKDVVVSNESSNSISYFRNTSTPGSITSSSLAAKINFATGSTPRFVAVSDLDGDGKSEIIVSNFSSNTISIYSNQTNQYTVTGIGSNGCTNTKTVTLTLNAIPTITVSNPSPICPGGSAVITANGASTYSWSPSTGLSSTTGNSVIANPTITTTYTVVGTSECGIENSATVLVKVNTEPAIVIEASSNQICLGEHVTLSATGASSYSWAPLSGLSNSNGSIVSASPTQTTTYTLTTIGLCGTTNTSFVTITVIPLPGLVISTYASTICKGNALEITASGSTGYTWAPATGLNTTTGNVVIASPLVSTTYTVISTDNNNGCTNTAIVEVVIDCPDEIVGCCFSNYGASVEVEQGTHLNVYCNLLNELGGVINSELQRGDFKNMNHVNVLLDWIHNAKNDLYVAPRLGTTSLFGTYQKMMGNSNTWYNQLDLDGNGTKTIKIDEYAEANLNLTNNELATTDYTFFVEKKDVNAITGSPLSAQAGGGFVSTDGNGYLSRRMNIGGSYLFPLGSTLNTIRFRPIEITNLNDADEMKVGFENRASSPQYDITQKAPNVLSLNTQYYHRISHAVPSSINKIIKSFFQISDGQFQSIAHWEKDQATVIPIYWWGGTSGSNVNTVPNVAGLVYALTNGVQGFDDIPFILAQSGFYVNTTNFGDPVPEVPNDPGNPNYTSDPDNPDAPPATGGTIITVTSPNPPTGGLGDPVPTGSTGGTTVFTPSPVSGNYDMEITPPNDCGIPGKVSFTINEDGTIDPASVKYSLGIGSPDLGELSPDVYTIDNFNSGIIFKSKPTSILTECVNNIKVSFGEDVEKDFVFNRTGSSPETAIEVVIPATASTLTFGNFELRRADDLVLVATSHNSMLPGTNSIKWWEIPALSGLDWVSPNSAAGLTAGVYRFSFTVTGLGFNEEVKGQFILK